MGEPEPEPEPPVEPPTVQCQQLGKNDCRATSGCFRFRRTCWPTAENGAVCANISKKKLCQIKDYVQFYAGSPGCSCAGSTEPDPIFAFSSGSVAQRSRKLVSASAAFFVSG